MVSFSSSLKAEAFPRVNSYLCCRSRSLICVCQPTWWKYIKNNGFDGWDKPGAPENEVPKGPVHFCSAARQQSPFVGLECTVRASSPAGLSHPPSSSPTQPTPGTLARSHRKLLADFSHIVTCWFVNSDKCNRPRAPSRVHLYASLAQRSREWCEKVVLGDFFYLAVTLDSKNYSKIESHVSPCLRLMINRNDYRV